MILDDAIFSLLFSDLEQPNIPSFSCPCPAQRSGLRNEHFLNRIECWDRNPGGFLGPFPRQADLSNDSPEGLRARSGRRKRCTSVHLSSIPMPAVFDYQALHANTGSRTAQGPSPMKTLHHEQNAVRPRPPPSLPLGLHAAAAGTLGVFCVADPAVL